MLPTFLFGNLGSHPTDSPSDFPPLNLSMISNIRQVPLFQCKSFLYEKYVVERLSTKEIAAQIFSSRSSVAKYLKLHGIPIRPNDVNNKTRSQLRYGEAWRRRTVTLHQRELDNIEKMRKLREQGFSYWKIADVFNSLGIRTKTDRGKWHARSIQKILEMTAANVESTTFS